MAEDSFGCAECYGEDGAAAFRHFQRGCVGVGGVVDDSHFIVGILRCRNCGQQFASIFTEFVDWHGGDDASYRTYLPLTDAEAAALADGGLDPLGLGELGADRRHLFADRPTGVPETRIHWGAGRFQVHEGG